MKVARLLGCLLAMLFVAGMLVAKFCYGDVFISLPIGIPATFVFVFLFFYIVSLINTNSFSELPKTLINFFRR